MAFQYFLKLDGVAGESIDAKFPNQIEVFSFSFGASNPEAVGAVGTGAKVDLSSLSLQTAVSKASPHLLLACEQGKVLKSGVLTGVNTGGTSSVPVVQLTMSPVVVDSISYGGAEGGGTPSESISLSYNTLKFTYWPTTTTGAQGTAVTTGWDASKNTPI